MNQTGFLLKTLKIFFYGILLALGLAMSEGKIRIRFIQKVKSHGFKGDQALHPGNRFFQDRQGLFQLANAALKIPQGGGHLQDIDGELSGLFEIFRSGFDLFWAH